ncbi:MAG: hypothetical protein ABIO16_17215, partial [Nocardioides sp.]
MNGERSSAEPTEVEIQSGAGVSAALVAGLVVVHLAMAYATSTLPGFVYDLVEPLAGDSTALLVVDLMPMLPLALVVLGVALTLPRGVVACAIVIAAALVGHALVGSWGVAPVLTFGAALA